MDQTNQIIDRLENFFSQPSLPGGGEAGKGLPGVAVQEAKEQEPKPAPAVGKAPAPLDDVAARYAHLDTILREQITSLLLIEQSYPIRGYLSADGLRAGIVMKPAVREYHWPEFCRYSRLFFGPAHEALCTIFKNELQAMAVRYGKNEPITKERELYGD